MEIVVIVFCLVIGVGWYRSNASNRKILDEKAQLENALAKERNATEKQPDEKDAAERYLAERNRAVADSLKEQQRANNAEAAIAKEQQRADTERKPRQ